MHRLLLESMCHQMSSFVTLTYSDQSLPLTEMSSKHGPLPTLRPLELSHFMKRLRRAIEPERIRFFAVGEYGDTTFRPHYHVALFGFASCERGRTLRRVETFNAPVWRDCCSRCRLVGDTWGLGNVDLGQLTSHSAAYIAGYVVKKMTSADDTRLRGRHPEFARMSLRPGIGADSLWSVALKLKELGWEEGTDVPSSLNHGTKSLPLGRYLRSKLRVVMDRPGGAPENALQAIEAELLPVRLAARSSETEPSFKKALLDATEGRYRAVVANEQLWKKGRSL